MTHKMEIRSDGRLRVPENSVIPYIEGDGVGPDIWRASMRVFVQSFRGVTEGRRRTVGLRSLQERRPSI